MSRLQVVLDLECFEEFSFQKLAQIQEAFVTEDQDSYKPISGKFTSSQTVDLLDGYTDLKNLVVVAYGENGKDDLKEVSFSITDSGATSVSITSPYLVLLGMSSADYNALTVTTSGASSSTPIFLKIFRLGT